MSPYSVGAVAATEGVVQVSVVRLVALVGCGGSVALGWLGCVWLVETYLAAVVKCSLVRGTMSLMGACNHAPAPMPEVE